MPNVFVITSYSVFCHVSNKIDIFIFKCIVINEYSTRVERRSDGPQYHDHTLTFMSRTIQNESE